MTDSDRLTPISAAELRAEMRDEIVELREKVYSLRVALKPFADMVHNDNGDITVSAPADWAEKCKLAYWAMNKAASQ